MTEQKRLEKNKGKKATVAWYMAEQTARAKSTDAHKAMIKRDTKKQLTNNRPNARIRHGHQS
jgi:hypothetical protein